jgi:uroporphyrinogen-III synthase
MARVLVTRAAEDAAGLCQALRHMGHRPVRVPLIERVWALDAMLEAVAAHPHVDWLVVTSGASADVLAAAAPSAWLRARIGAVGTATARKLAAMGRPADVVPRRQLGYYLARAMGDVDGRTIVYPKGDLAPPDTAEALREAGAIVHEVVCYHNVAPPGHLERLRAALPVDVTLLLSGSAAQRLRRAHPGDPSQLGRILAIGPSTAKVAEEVGLPVHGIAEPHSLEALLGLVPSPSA